MRTFSAWRVPRRWLQSRTAPQHSLPIIDISSFTLRAKTARRGEKEETAAAVRRACEEYGFFYIKGHGVPDDLVAGALAQAESFFALPTEKKAALDLRLSRSMRGYQASGVNVTKGRPDFHEGFDFFRETEELLPEEKGPTLHGRNQWPVENDLGGSRAFFEERYVPAMLRLGRSVMRCVAVGLGVPERFFDPFYERSFWIMRLTRYPSEGGGTKASTADAVAAGATTATAAAGGKVGMEMGAEGEGPLGVGEHTDYGCLTFINADATRGCLQARAPGSPRGGGGSSSGGGSSGSSSNGDSGGGGEWMSVDPVPGAFAVNLGDVLHVWTNGRFAATPHRVLRPAPGAPARLCVPFFFEPNSDAHIAPLLLDPGEKPKFPAFLYEDHLLDKLDNNFALQEGEGEDPVEGGDLVAAAAAAAERDQAAAAAPERVAAAAS